MTDVALRLHDVHKRYADRVVLDGVSLDVARGARVGLIGPAASGKSVLLKLACGLEPADRGGVELLGVALANLREAELGEIRKRVGMLFQNYALFDFLTVAGNVAFPLEQRGDLEGQVLADNAPMLAFVRHQGFHVRRLPEEPDVMEARLELARQ